MRRLSVRSALAAAAALAVIVAAGLRPIEVSAGPPTFTSAFGGQPAAPASWRAADWDVTVHSRDRETWRQLDPMAAHHGADCGPAPATHAVSRYEDAVFQCRDHLMTAINAGGYGMIYLTPTQQLDFSAQAGGTGHLRFDLSTQRASVRDWVDLWLTPYDDNLQLALDEWIPDGSGLPRRGLHVVMDTFFPESGPAQTIFKAFVIRDFAVTELPLATTKGYESVLEPSATRREVFELQLSRTRVRFGLPERGLWWIDAPTPDLGWDQAVVQLGHHSYNPTKLCDPPRLAPHHVQACGPNTWHWNNIVLFPARPFTVVHADQRDAGPGADAAARAPQPAELRFQRAAPARAHLRFAGIGANLELSVDGGETWRPAELQARSKDPAPEDHFKSYWTPVPAGTRAVLVRGAPWSGGDWLVRDVSLWSPTSDVEVAGVSVIRRPAALVLFDRLGDALRRILPWVLGPSRSVTKPE
ncbi:MAG TPA: hypothetical protein VFX49_20520 [Chloroflexota bacterium]|nr:hypothetical protein [Chloroflexota bacterium]